MYDCSICNENGVHSDSIYNCDNCDNWICRWCLEIDDDNGYDSHKLYSEEEANNEDGVCAGYIKSEYCMNCKSNKEINDLIKLVIADIEKLVVRCKAKDIIMNKIDEIIKLSIKLA